MITAESVSVFFGEKTAVDRVSLTVPDHGTLGLVGPNGSGKTTLLRALYGSVDATGTVLLDGKDITAMRRRDIARSVSVVSQERDSDIPITVADLVELGALPHRGLFSFANEEPVAQALESVGILHLAQRDVSDLSGGERQRALIARALVQDAKHVLLDEPTNHLDIRYQHEVLELVTDLPGGSVVVLHDLNLAARYCDRIAVLKEGRIVAEGTPEEVLIPEILEPVYEIKVRRLNLDGEITLVYPRKARV